MLNQQMSVPEVWASLEKQSRRRLIIVMGRIARQRMTLHARQGGRHEDVITSKAGHYH